jgi:hypothetical protein
MLVILSAISLLLIKSDYQNSGENFNTGNTKINKNELSDDFIYMN